MLSFRALPMAAAERRLCRLHPPAASRSLSASSSGGGTPADIFTPTPEHAALRHMVRGFTAEHVEPQAIAHNREERFNEALFRQCGELGLLGLTVGEKWGGSSGDATSVAIVHEELAYSDPAFCLSYLAHSLLFANNLGHNGTDEQRERLLPRACSGDLLGGMCMSEPGAGTDVLGMTTRATRVDADTFELTGTKARREAPHTTEYPRLARFPLFLFACILPKPPDVDHERVPHAHGAGGRVFGVRPHRPAGSRGGVCISVKTRWRRVQPVFGREGCVSQVLTSLWLACMAARVVNAYTLCC